jgi:hypothetical protein
VAAPQVITSVQIQPNSSGQAIDVVLVDYQPLNTLPTQPPLVGRQGMVITDSNIAANQASVTGAGELRVIDQAQIDVMAAVLVQLRILNSLLVQSPTLGLNNQNPSLDALEAQLISAARASRI